MGNVIRNHKTSLLKDPAQTDIKECNRHRKPECPFDKNYLSECLVYSASVDRLDTNKLNIIMELKRRTSESVITTTLHLLEIKAKKKALNSKNTSVS